MNKTYIIYLHRNKINGKCYVGQTSVDPLERWGINGYGYHNQQYFYRAIQKYGWDNFEHIILESNLTVEDVNERERYWGEYYDALVPNGYSLYLGDTLQSEKSGIKKSNALKEKWHTDTNYAEHMSKVQKEKWKNWSPEVQEKILKNTNPRKRVRCIETNIIYTSMREAGRQTGINASHIAEVCRGERKSAGKCHWEVVE